MTTRSWLPDPICVNRYGIYMYSLQRCVDFNVCLYVTDINIYINILFFRVAYNMIGCSQLYTGNCFTVDISPVTAAIQEVDALLGYECSQMNAMPTSDEECKTRNDTCEGVYAIDYCFYIWYGAENICP